MGMPITRMLPFLPATSILIGLLGLPAGSAHASLYDDTCGDLSGTTSSDPVDEETSVEIGDFGASAPADARKEHVRISQGLADALNITSGSVSTSGPAVQVRVALTNVVADSSANFTVVDIDATDPGLRLDVYLPDDVDVSGDFDDLDNGFYKLFGDTNTLTAFGANPEATVYRAAPGTTVVVDGMTTTEYVHFAEPDNASNRYFRECVEVRDDELAVLVPHGGSIELNISAEIPDFLTDLETEGHDPSVWEAAGRWSSGTFRRWHITSTQLSSKSFPGFELLEDSGP